MGDSCLLFTFSNKEKRGKFFGIFHGHFGKNIKKTLDIKKYNY